MKVILDEVSTGLSIYSKNGNVKIEDVVFINGTVTGVNSVDVQGIDDRSTLLNMVGSLNQHGRIFQIQSTPGMLQPDIFMSGGGGSDRARGHITVGYAGMEVLGKLTVDETIKMKRMETKSFAVQPDDNFEDMMNETSLDIYANSIRNINVLTMNVNG